MASEKNGSLAKSRVSDAFCKATSIIINQPAPELSKRRQTKLYKDGRITVDAQEKDKQD
jgi:hypothetical protein